MFNITELSESHVVLEACVQLIAGIFNVGLAAGSPGLSSARLWVRLSDRWLWVKDSSASLFPFLLCITCVLEKLQHHRESEVVTADVFVTLWCTISFDVETRANKKKKLFLLTLMLKLTPHLCSVLALKLKLQLLNWIWTPELDHKIWAPP